MDEILTARAEQPDEKKEWTVPTLKQLDLSETHSGADFLDDGLGSPS